MYEPAASTGKLSAVAEAQPPAVAPAGSGSVPPDVPAPATGHLAAGPRARRPARYGLSIQFDNRPDDPELGRLVESTV